MPHEAIQNNIVDHQNYYVSNVFFLDIDECTEDPRLCLGGSCQNLAGTFSCDCPKGFSLNTQSRICEGKDLFVQVQFSSPFDFAYKLFDCFRCSNENVVVSKIKLYI